MGDVRWKCPDTRSANSKRALNSLRPMLGSYLHYCISLSLSL